MSLRACGPSGIEEALTFYWCNYRPFHELPAIESWVVRSKLDLVFACTDISKKLGFGNAFRSHSSAIPEPASHPQLSRAFQSHPEHPEPSWAQPSRFKSSFRSMDGSDRLWMALWASGWLLKMAHRGPPGFGRWVGNPGIGTAERRSVVDGPKSWQSTKGGENVPKGVSRPITSRPPLGTADPFPPATGD